MASRNRMDMSKVLFDRLISNADIKGLIIKNSSEKRYIERLNEDDAKLMAKASYDSLVVTRHVKIVKITHEDGIKFSVFGLSEPEQLPSGLIGIDLTPGTFAISVIYSDTHPAVSVTSSEIRDAIEDGFHVDGGDYNGHDLKEIFRLFPSINLFEVNEAQDYHNDNYRVIGSFLSRTYLDGPIQLEPDTIDAISTFFETASFHIPYKNVVQGILSISWDGLFLELYRCLEQLYACSKLAPLTEKWKTSSSLRDIAALLENEISWRPKEDESLIGLISECENQTVVSAYSAFGGQNPYGELKNPADTVGKMIYKLRNSIVHYRPAHEAIQKSDAEWNAIARVMLQAIEQSYQRLGESFFGTTAA